MKKIILIIFCLNSILCSSISYSLPIKTDTTLVAALLDKAHKYERASIPDSSIIFYKKAAVIYQESKNWERYVNTNIKISEQYLQLFNHTECFEFAKVALETGLKYIGENHASIAESYHLIGKYYRSKGSFNEALENYQKALVLRLKIFGNNHVDVADSYHYISECYMNQGKYDKSLENSQKDLAILLDLIGEKDSRIARAYDLIGICYSNKQDYKLALSNAKKGLKIRLDLFGENDTEVADSYSNLGLFFYELGRYEEAIQSHHKALTIRINFLGEAHPDLATTYNNLGMVYEAVGPYSKALIFYQKSLKIVTETFGEEHPKVSISYSNIALCYMKQKAFDEAENYIFKALDIMIKSFGESHPYVAITYINIGDIFQKNGDNKQAVIYFEKALSYCLNIFGDKSTYVAMCNSFLANCYRSEGNYKKAILNYQKALRIWRNIYGEEHPYIIEGYHNLGLCFYNQKIYDQSLSFYHKSLKLGIELLGKKHPTIVSIYQSMGLQYLEMNDYNNALKSIQNGLIAAVSSFSDKNIKVNPNLIKINTRVGLLTLLELKARTISQVEDKKSTKENLRLSLATYELAINLLDTIRFDYSVPSAKQDFTEKSISIFEGAVATAYQLFELTEDKEYLSRTFRFAEKSKSFLLRQALNESKAKSFAGIPDSLIAKEKELKMDISFYEKQLFESEKSNDTIKINLYQNGLFTKRKNFRAFLKSLEKNYPKYHQLKFKDQIASVKELQTNFLNQNEIFVEYFQNQNHYYIFSISQDDINCRRIEKKQSFESSINALRVFISTAPGTNDLEKYNSYRENAFTLYEKLLKPELAESKKDKLIITPDGILNLLPFEILLSNSIMEAKGADQIRYKSMPYLLSQYQISYAYSGTLLYENSKLSRRDNNGECLALAPSYKNNNNKLEVSNRGTLNDLVRSNEFGLLPGAQEEVKKLAQHVKGSFLFGAEATEYNFKKNANKYSLLHLAMHGTSDDKTPLYSRLYFSEVNNSNEDDTLHTYELYNMELAADLVVLSACETGKGKFVKGEGIVSLARAFMFAGCPSVVQTLWSASDKTTPEIMSEFYKALSIGHSKDEALSIAKQQFLLGADNRYSHPFYWATFVLYGDKNPLSFKNNKIYLLWISTGGIVLLAFVIWQFKLKKERAT